MNHLSVDSDSRSDRNRSQVRAAQLPGNSRILPITRFCDGGKRGGGADVKDQSSGTAVEVAHAVSVGWRNSERKCNGALRCGGGRYDLEVVGHQVMVETLAKDGEQRLDKMAGFWAESQIGHMQDGAVK